MKISDQNKEKLEQQYDLLAHKFNELYLAGKGRGREAMTVALQKSHEQLTALGEFSAEQGEELKQYLARDLDQTISDAKQLGEEAKVRLHPARLGAGALSSLANVLELTSNALHSLGDKAKNKLTYKTGEMTSAGTLTCQGCGQQVQLKKTGHVPPCSKCNGILFNKGY
ncbi:MAG: Isocitrate dehydrogenase [Candidatus Gallionella acididurans]|uniref:Isocitrate dehydrogenase n=1 Tax=Candidatus Gallionella acididurans TaxID=1796491 RepID=A0A139BRM9_9PROT|nr:MAG: Isocitrate dehydrogenase [Candidatus Gallionella acididurans]